MKYLRDLTRVSHTWAHHEELLVFYQLLESEKTVITTTVNNVQQTKLCSMMLSLVALTKYLIRDTPPLT